MKQLLYKPAFRKVAVILAALTLLLAVAASQSGPGGLFESFDSGYQGWSVNKGQLSTSRDDKRGGAGSLEWRFDYIKDALYLYRRSDLGRFSQADGISFAAKSDREGPMFLRVDLRDKSPFIIAFNVERDWKTFTFKWDEFQAVGKNKRLNPDQMSAIYFVDLGGKDNGQTGSRTVRVDDIVATGLQSGSSSGAPARSGELVLKAYDENGKLLNTYDLKDRGTSGAEYMFATDLQGTSMAAKISSEKADNVSVPSVAAQGNPTAIKFLYWVVPGYGKVSLNADNAGAGYRSGDTLNVNYELARSRFAKLDAAIKNEGGADAGIQRAARRAQELLAKAERDSDDRRKAQASDEALNLILHASDDLQLAIARRDIERNRKGDLTVTVLGSNGRPAANVDVEYEETRSAVLFGCIQSFGFVDQKLNDQRFQQVADTMKDAGFNHFTVSLFWDQIEPKEGGLRLDEWDRKLGLDFFKQRGFTFTAHAIVQSALPNHVKKAGAGRFAELSTRHMEDVMRHYMEKYPGQVKIWQAINEPSSNRYVGLDMDAKVDLIRRLTDTIHRTDPNTPVLVNDYDWDRGQRHKANFLQPDLKDMVSSVEYFDLLNRRRVPYDLMGLQWYPGLRVMFGGIIDLSEPLLDFAATSDIWDRYGKLGKPLHLTEMAVPGINESGWKNGYWHQPWNPEIQAEYMTNVYTVAFSKPYIREITYWGITDHEPWARKGGMLDDRYQPKPLYNSLKNLLTSWKTRGSGRTDANGQIRIRGFAGDYVIRSAKREITARIDERQSRTTTLKM